MFVLCWFTPPFLLFCRGAVDESGEQFVAYFLPTEETMRKRKADFEQNIDYTPDQE